MQLRICDYLPRSGRRSRTIGVMFIRKRTPLMMILLLRREERENEREIEEKKRFVFQMKLKEKKADRKEEIKQPKSFGSSSLVLSELSLFIYTRQTNYNSE